MERLAAEAVQNELLAVCVHPVHVSRVARVLAGDSPFVVSVVGFPTGAVPARCKAREAAFAVEQGAGEVDMVIRLDLLKNGEFNACEADIAEVVRSVSGAGVKVIIETCLLSDEEKKTACRISEAAGAAFVKTSTGFFGPGATVADVRLMRESVSSGVGIKASGGIKTFAQAEALRLAGATRIGCSASLAIVSGEREGN